MTAPGERRLVPAEWYDGFFEREYLDEVALRIEPERTEQQTEFVAERLGLEPGATVLDLACGHGRIALELARRGYRVTGLDLSPRSIALAREAGEGEGLEVEWVEADMRDLPAGRTFAGIINVFTAIGYFEDEAENQRVLDGVAAALRPGGRFLIDTINLLGLAGRYRDRMWEPLVDGKLMLQEHEFDFLRARNRAVWTFVREDGSRSELAHSVRLYTPHEVVGMLERAGLEVEGAWGDWDGSELSFQSRRIIMLARRPS